MKFLDEVKIYISSGNGGPGCISFRRQANVPKGGPDGGDGGKGGDVIIKTVSGLNTLIDFRYRQHFKAEHGKHGSKKNKTGKKLLFYSYFHVYHFYKGFTVISGFFSIFVLPIS